MNTQSTQQYHEFIREFLTLFDEIKKEDDPIYNSRIGFNAVKFLIKHPIWNLDKDEDKNEACEVILQEHNKMQEDRQGLQRKAKEILSEYIYGNVNDVIKEVSIYGDHASITLGDDKKEFKISEFLNSDFCQKKGISGFSTLHSDGKSGMHGFVAEEGRKKIRHYVVTNGSYEMTLNWNDKNGKKCTIKIKIDEDGVDLTERNGVTEEQLKANTDVKIGGLFLYQIQFRKKGQEQENQQSSEIFIESDISKGIGVQATQDQEVESKHATTSTTNSNNASAKKIPPSLPPRTSSLPNNQQKGEHQPIRINSGNNYNPPYSDHSNSTAFIKSVSQNQNDRQKDKQSTFTTFGYTESGSKKNERENSISGQGKTQQQEERSRKALLQNIRNFEENNLRHIDIDNRAEKNGENNLWKKIMNTIPYLPSSDIHEHNSDNQGASDADWEESEQQFPVLIPKSTNGFSYSSPEAPEEHGKNSKSETHKTPITNPVDQVWLKDKIEDKEDNRIISTEKNIDVAGLLKDNAAEREINDSGYSSPTYTSHYNFQVNPEQLEKKLETIEPKETLEKLNKGLREPSRQATKDLFSENMLEKIKEGEKYDPVRKLLERKVAEQENDNTNLTIDKNSELYKLLEKDAAQLKAGVIEEERKDTLTEHNDSPDRNRIALANKSRIWAKLIAEEKQKKDGGISIG